ncbi:MAG: HAD hydrolase family protein, partial [Candidatus Brocadiia bacterium]
CFRVVFGSKDKAADILDVCKQADISPDETAFLGDDLPDIRAMKRVAVSFAVMNATGEVRESADIVLSSTGGHGALREVIENIMKIQGRWDEALKEYFD